MRPDDPDRRLADLAGELRSVKTRLRAERRLAVAAVLGALALAAAADLASETLTLTTYYPSPAGIYRTLTTTLNTVLGRDGGLVGIGTATPQSVLDVRSTTSGILPPRMTQAQIDALATPGSVAYNATTGDLGYRSATEWRPLRAAGRQYPVSQATLRTFHDLCTLSDGLSHLRMDCPSACNRYCTDGCSAGGLNCAGGRSTLRYAGGTLVEQSGVMASCLCTP